jgi:hypothetical protein
MYPYLRSVLEGKQLLALWACRCTDRIYTIRAYSLDEKSFELQGTETRFSSQ